MEEFIAFAETAFSSRQFEAVVQRFANIPDAAPRTPLALAWVGRAQFELGAFSEARRLLAEAISTSTALPGWARIVLQHATWMDQSPFSEELPDRIRDNIAIFGHFVTTLIELGDTSAPLPDDRFTAATLAMHWVKTGIRTVVLDQRNQDLRTELTSLGLATSFLDAVAKGPKAVADACADLSTDVPFAAQPDMSPRLFDVASAVLLRAKPVLCPFTGRRALAHESVDLYVYRYRHDNKTCLILADDTAAYAASDSAWFVPGHRLLITAANWGSLFTTLARALARAFDNRQAVARYLTARKERPIMVTDISVGHLGHYTWNVISGWSRLFSLISAEKIDIITTHRQLQIFGGVKELYPDYSQRVGELIEIDNDHAAYQTMLDRGALALTLVDRHITQDLATRVIEWCRHHCAPEFLRTVAEFRSASRPLLLVTIRLENRAWIEQESGLPQIINHLAVDFPGLGVVLDGLNAGIHSLDTHAFMSLDQEQRLAKHIIDSCPDVRIYNSIGCTPAESIVWCEAVDTFLAPIGAGMAKYRWITNKLGVAYSNETCLTPNSYDGRLYERHRDGVVPMEYVAREAVTDVEAKRHGLIFRANFSMEWKMPYFKIRDLLARLFPTAPRRHSASAIYEVEQNSGFWNVQVSADIIVPVRLNGQPFAAPTRGWRAKFVYAGFAPVLLLELVHENGTVATWFLDDTMNRIAGGIDELTEERRVLLRDKLQAGLDDVDGFVQVNEQTVMAIRALVGPTATG